MATLPGERKAARARAEQAFPEPFKSYEDLLLRQEAVLESLEEEVAQARATHAALQEEYDNTKLLLRELVIHNLDGTPEGVARAREARRQRDELKIALTDLLLRRRGAEAEVASLKNKVARQRNLLKDSGTRAATFAEEARAYEELLQACEKREGPGGSIYCKGKPPETRARTALEKRRAFLLSLMEAKAFIALRKSEYLFLRGVYQKRLSACEGLKLSHYEKVLSLLEQQVKSHYANLQLREAEAEWRKLRGEGPLPVDIVLCKLAAIEKRPQAQREKLLEEVLATVEERNGAQDRALFAELRELLVKQEGHLHMSSFTYLQNYFESKGSPAAQVAREARVPSVPERSSWSYRESEEHLPLPPAPLELAYLGAKAAARDVRAQVYYKLALKTFLSDKLPPVESCSLSTATAYLQGVEEGLQPLRRQSAVLYQAALQDRDGLSEAYFGSRLQKRALARVARPGAEGRERRLAKKKARAKLLVNERLAHLSWKGGFPATVLYVMLALLTGFLDPSGMMTALALLPYGLLMVVYGGRHEKHCALSSEEKQYLLEAPGSRHDAFTLLEERRQALAEGREVPALPLKQEAKALAAASSTPSPKLQEEWEALGKRGEAVVAEWTEASTNLELILKRPLLQDYSHPLVQEVVKAVAQWKRGFPATVPAGVTEVSTSSWGELVTSLEGNVALLLRQAKKAALSGYSPQEVKLVEEALLLLRKAQDEGSPTEERQLSYQQLLKLAQRLNLLLEPATRAALEAAHPELVQALAPGEEA